MDPLWGASPSVESFSLDLHGLFVGREAELGRLRQLFEDGAPGVVVFGPAGTGKTALAEVFAFRGKEGFPGGIFRLTASDAENPQHLLERAFGEEFDKPTSVTAGTLLIVNNAETIDERGQRTLTVWLSDKPQVHTLLTSRIPLRALSNFRHFELLGLSNSEFVELMRLRHAFVHQELPGDLSETLFDVGQGSPRFAGLLSALMLSHEAISWREILNRLRNYHVPGLVDPNGRPLRRESQNFKAVIVDVASTNADLIRLLKKNPELAWTLPPRKFEEIVAEILDKQGYDVSLSPASGDGGFDICAARKEGLGTFLYLVECKRYVPPNKVGVEIVRGLHGVVQLNRATAGAIVTTSYFTRGASEYQRQLQHQLQLHDYIALQKWIEKFPVLKKSDL